MGNWWSILEVNTFSWRSHEFQHFIGAFIWDRTVWGTKSSIDGWILLAPLQISTRLCSRIFPLVTSDGFYSGFSGLTHHLDQILHQNLSCVVSPDTEPVLHTNKIILADHMGWKWLINVVNDEVYVLWYPVSGWILLIGDINSIDSYSRWKFLSQFCWPDTNFR